MRDMKEALSGARKPDLTHLRGTFAAYVVRPCEYGSDKYERANYLRSTGDGPHTEPTAADFERLRGYARAAVSHIMCMLDSMERHQANDPHLLDVEGMKRAAYAVDTDFKVGQKVGASMLPHIAPACASLQMAIEQAADCGLLPRDPGTPWRETAPKCSKAGDPGYRAGGQTARLIEHRVAQGAYDVLEPDIVVEASKHMTTQPGDDPDAARRAATEAGLQTLAAEQRAASIARAEHEKRMATNGRARAEGVNL